VAADFGPAGDQQQAIDTLAAGVKAGDRHQVLKGVTGSGKTFSMAKVIEATQLPTLVISHNKTLAAQLYREFKGFLPDNAVEYFVSYYDYYQPEAYVPSRDLYIAKDASINDDIDRLRLSATTSLLERRDVVVVATVSCIYGIGDPGDYRDMRISIRRGEQVRIGEVLRRLVSLQYVRNDAVLERSRFRLRGDVLEVYPSYSEEAVRIELAWDEVERIRRIQPISGQTLEELESVTIYPAKYFVLPEQRVRTAVERIKAELSERYEAFRAKGRQLEAERIKSRTEYDLEMLESMGYCPGIENYSAPLAGRKTGERPAVLLDFFPEDALMFIDESHVTVPQIRGMYEGDRSRKLNLVDFGFRLPSAMDNRPLYFGEFEALQGRTIYVSATPSAEEVAKSVRVVEQLIRPTGLLDPEIEVRSSHGQIEDLYAEIRLRVESDERVLVTVLTKKMAEDLTDYFADLGLAVRYLHAEVETFERVELLKGLRSGDFDVLVGINLLREGLDLPEVSLIAIVDADKIGFLRSATSLIQTIGRAARNVNGKVIMYADRVSDAMKGAIEETGRRRAVQSRYNAEHGITPQTIRKSIQDILVRQRDEKRGSESVNIEVLKRSYNLLLPKDRAALRKRLEEEMLELAKNLEFERAALVRDEIGKLDEMPGGSK